jgi:hypothetical protein
VRLGDYARAERHDAATGRLLASTTVPSGVADELDIERSTIVYRVGREVRTLNASTGASSPLALAATSPVGLAIEGSRVVWAENGGGAGRIVSVVLGG